MWPEEFKRVVFAAVRVPEMSGGSTYVETMSNALAAEGVEVQHVSLRPGTRQAKFPTTVVFARERLHAGPVLRGHGNPLRRAWAVPLVAFKWVDRRRGLRRYRRLIESFGPDTVVIFTHVKAKIVLRESGFRRGFRGAIFIGQHHSSFDSLNYETWLRDALPAEFADVDAFTALTDEDAQDFAQLIGIPCYGIGNPLPSGISPGDDREPIAVALARYSGEKQLDVMIRAFAEATSVPELGDWQLHLYGEGDLRDELQACIDSVGVGDRVQLKGRTDDVPGVLRTASVNLLTSRYEGFGMSILEAAAAGIPSVVFNCSPGVRRLVPPEAGYLVPNGDEEAYARMLQLAMQNDAERAQRGRAAVHVANDYLPEKVVHHLGILVADASVLRVYDKDSLGRQDHKCIVGN